jgi:hypothetical protein
MHMEGTSQAGSGRWNFRRASVIVGVAVVGKRLTSHAFTRRRNFAKTRSSLRNIACTVSYVPTADERSGRSFLPV